MLRGDKDSEEEMEARLAKTTKFVMNVKNATPGSAPESSVDAALANSAKNRIVWLHFRKKGSFEP